MPLAEGLVLLLGIYAAAGLLFAAAFLWKGIARVDAAAHQTGLAFRLLILPGCAAFWPLLLRRWVQS